MDHQASITSSDLETALLDEASEPKALPTSILAGITNDFSVKQEISRGGSVVVYKENRGSASELPILDVHPLELRFPTKRNDDDDYIMCPVHLTNNTSEYVAFRLIDKGRLCNNRHLHGIVPPRSTCTLFVRAKDNEMDYGNILHSSIWGEKYLVQFKDGAECDGFFKEAKEMGNAVHEVALKSVYTPQGKMGNTVHGVTSGLSEPPIRPIIKFTIAMYYITDLTCSVDAHPTEPWIIAGDSKGKVHTWNYQTQTRMNSFEVAKQESIEAVKFVARKQWVLAGTSDGFIHVYHCDFVTELRKITSFCASSFDSLAVHLSKPYVFSSGWGMTLWDWDKGWQCIQDFDCVANEVAFNPDDANSFASAAYGASAEIWSLDSGCQEYDRPGHSRGVNCLDFFTCDGRQYLVTGSDDCTAKIWDLQNKSCIHTLETMSPVTHVVSLPDAPYLITGSENHIVHVWSSIDFRLERIIHIGGGMWSGSDDLGRVHSLVCCLVGSRRVVIGQEFAISVMHIDDNEVMKKQVSSEGID